jgi:hypothetical protein
MPGCFAYANAVATFPLSNVTGTTTWIAPVPAAASLAGLALFLQVVVASPGSNPTGVVTSNACELRLGAR